MYKIEIDTIDKCEVLECSVQDLPSILKYIDNSIRDKDNCKVTVNGNLFNKIPNLVQINNMPGYNPIVKMQLLKLLKNYPTVQAIGFDGHTSEYRGVGGDITIHASGDKQAIYNLASSVSKLYNTEDEYSPTYNLVGCVFSGIDSGYTEILKKGVDF